MIKLSDIFPSKLAEKSVLLSENDLVIVNVLFFGMITGDLLAGDISKAVINSGKKRPVVVYQVDKKKASYFAISTNENCTRPIDIIFDYSNCRKKTDCGGMNFKHKGYVFFLVKEVRKRGIRITISAKFNFNINKLLKHLSQPKRIKQLLGNNMVFSDVFSVCGDCDKNYIANIIKRIDL